MNDSSQPCAVRAIEEKFFSTRFSAEHVEGVGVRIGSDSVDVHFGHQMDQAGDYCKGCGSCESKCHVSYFSVDLSAE